MYSVSARDVVKAITNVTEARVQLWQLQVPLTEVVSVAIVLSLAPSKAAG
jgi:hypothetical protein